MNLLTTTKDGKIVVNRPMFDTAIICNHYSQKDGVPVKYVCTTSLTERGQIMDVFYRETPHPEFGNKYFGIFMSGDVASIHHADCVEELSFGMIQDSEGSYHYSRHVHDYHTVEGDISIDGGRDYTKTSGKQLPNVTTFKIENGDFNVQK